jgi:hypothetical protein
MSFNLASQLIFGLQSMNGESKELRSVISALSDKLPEDFTAIGLHSQGGGVSYDVGVFMYGLQHVSTENCPKVISMAN